MDVLIIGGGPAGLSAAMAIGRMGQTALVCDDNRPRNAPAAHMNNFPSRDGMNPLEWRQQVRSELGKYKTILLFDGSVKSLIKDGAEFIAQLSDGSTERFRKVVLATGVQDQLKAVPGLQELWGHSVFHCPYCHGFEVRDQKFGLVANGPFAKHLMPMIYALSKDLVLFTSGKSDLDEDFRKILSGREVPIIETEIAILNRDGEALQTVGLKNGETVVRDCLFWAPTLPFHQKSSLGEKLGCEVTEMGFYRVDPMFKTNIPGVFAAGDSSSPMHTVLAAAAAGQFAGAGAVAEILTENFMKC